MRIQRRSSQLSFRRRRRPGCRSLWLLLCLLPGVLVAASWHWFGRWSVAPPQTHNESLRAALQAFQDGDLDAAIARARLRLAPNPEDDQALALLTRTLIYRSYSDHNRAEDRATALQLTETALAQGAAADDMLALHAFALQVNDQLRAARDVASAVLKRSPQHALARMALALAYSSAGNHEAALRHSLLAVAAPGWRLDTQRALAISYSGVGDYERAVASVEHALELNGRLLPLLFERALYARQLGDAGAASVAWFRVLAIDPGNVKARLRLCELSSILREREQAITWCRQVTARAPAWAEGWYWLGYEYFLQGDFHMAQASFKQCAALQQEQAVPLLQRRLECWVLQGQAAELTGDCIGLLRAWREFRAMARKADLGQTWVYPPEGPATCLTPPP